MLIRKLVDKERFSQRALIDLLYRERVKQIAVFQVYLVRLLHSLYLLAAKLRKMFSMANRFYKKLYSMLNIFTYIRPTLHDLFSMANKFPHKLYRMGNTFDRIGKYAGANSSTSNIMGDTTCSLWL